MKYFAGIDLGSSFAKAVIIDENSKVLARETMRSGVSFEEIAKLVFDKALSTAKLKESDIQSLVSTGVGRQNCPFAKFNKPEIGCFAKGVHNLRKSDATIIDIGGQDNKIIKIDKQGRQLSFKMNRKCAAGTGAFIEEIAFKLSTTPEEMNRLAETATECVEIGSYCTVFSGTEIIKQIRLGNNANAIFKGVFYSVVKRLLEMDSLEGEVILTGGAIANNPVLVSAFKETVKNPIFIPEFPQSIGALGAAVYGLQNYEKELKNV